MALAQRVAAAGLAVAITAGLLALFLERAVGERPSQGVVVMLRLVAEPRPPTARDAAPSPARADTPLAREREPPQRSRAFRPVAPARADDRATAVTAIGGSLAPSAPAAPAAPVPAEDAASSPPLRLDDRTLRRAIAAARASSPLGVSLTDRTPAEARLGQGIERAAKPDCLAPNPGGSLLSIPLIAAAAIAGHCK